MNKDTETVFRYKFRIIGRGEVHYPTKVEVSFRPPSASDHAISEPVADGFVTEYLGPGNSLVVRHYDRAAAVRQKLAALVGRSQVQARDVFDLQVLGFTKPGSPMVEHIVEHVELGDLEAALDRTLEISFGEYDGQVVEFLSDDVRGELRTESAWDGIRLEVIVEGVVMVRRIPAFGLGMVLLPVVVVTMVVRGKIRRGIRMGVRLHGVRMRYRMRQVQNRQQQGEAGPDEPDRTPFRGKHGQQSRGPRACRHTEPECHPAAGAGLLAQSADSGADLVFDAGSVPVSLADVG